MVELLVTITVTGVTLASAVSFFTQHLHRMRSHTYRLEALQGLRSSLDAVERDIRLAGACLPPGGQFIALAGANGSPGPDSVTLRSGVVRPNLSCVITRLTAPAPAGTTTLSVEDANGFFVDLPVYVRHPNGGGQIAMATAAGGTTVSIDAGLTQDYPGDVATGNTSSVYALDERIYQVDSSDPSVPVLALTINRNVPQAFAVGIEDLQVRYVLNRNCPPCDVVDLPADTVEWQLVNEVTVGATARTVNAPMDQATFAASTRGKPRNLLP
jgi:hypothetical protein